MRPPADASAVPALFDLSEVRVAAGDRALLEGITCRFAPGRICGLIGSNGSGKSTLMRLLARQARPGSGRILFRGGDLAAVGQRDFARQVVYLPQFTPPTDGIAGRGTGRPRPLPLARSPRPFRGAGPGEGGRGDPPDRYRAFRGRAVASLSGGERQRVWLAMLLAQDAACLLLDEPTSALDIAHQIDVLSLVRALARESDLGVIVILHDINMAARYCNDIVALGAARIACPGPATCSGIPCEPASSHPPGGSRRGGRRRPVPVPPRSPGPASPRSTAQCLRRPSPSGRMWWRAPH